MSLNGLYSTRTPISIRFYQTAAISLHLTFLRDTVETTAESVIAVVEKVAKVTEKVAANVANGLPGDGKVKTAALKIEDIAEQVDKDAEKAEAFIRKADKIEEEVDALMEPIIEEGEVIEKEIEENKEAGPTTDQSKATVGANDQK